jgi:5-methylcytosine-specific restriction endonuclease McrA
MKTCKDCGILKELNAFHKTEKWYRNRCKVCHNAKYQPATGKPNVGRFPKGHMPANPFKKGGIPWIKGKKLPEDIRKKMGRPGRKQSPEEIEKRRKSLLKAWGSHISYKRHSQATRRWSREVRKRDNFTCQHCGTNPKRLHAHHIVSWKDNEMLRHEISNGITLCTPCHIKAHENDQRIGPLKGRVFTAEHRKKLSEAKKGKAPWNKGLKGELI